MRSISLILLLVCTLGLPPIFAVAATRAATAPGLVLIVHPPWQDGARLAHSAGGRPIGPEQAPLGTFASSSDQDGFVARLRQAGAWAVVDARTIAALCGTPGGEVAAEILHQTERTPSS